MAANKKIPSETELPNKTAPPQEVVIQLPLTELHSFPNHPFQVRDDDSMKETTESVKQFGVLVPAIVRPVPEGGYEIVFGHRRKHASELAGLDTMPSAGSPSLTTRTLKSNGYSRTYSLPNRKKSGKARFAPIMTRAVYIHSDLSRGVKNGQNPAIPMVLTVM